MVYQKRKTVFIAESHQVEAIGRLVEAGHYRSTSEFIREAIEEKLERLRRLRLSEQVARYCAEGHGDEDAGLIDHQAFEDR